MNGSSLQNAHILGSNARRAKFFPLAKTLLIGLLVIGSCGLLSAQSYNLNNNTNGTIQTVPNNTTINFYDSGGPTGQYANNEDRNITFTSANGFPLQITFTQLSLRNGDRLRVYDGTSAAGTSLGDYQNTTTAPGTLYTNGASVYFTFTSDRNQTRDGWAIQIRSLSPIDDGEITTCSAVFTDKQGNANYDNNQFYKVTYVSGEPGMNVKLDFTQFNLGTGDWLRILDGDTLNAPIIGNYTGNGSPGTLFSSNDKLTAVFYANATNNGPGWRADVSCFAPTTYYSYTNGAWNDYRTWTTDPSGTNFDNEERRAIPLGMDRVVILNGNTVTANGNNSVTQLDIQQGAVLDVGTSTNNNFGTVMGKGTLRSVSAVLPDGVYTLFTQAEGGTIEIYGNSSGNLSLATVNNLLISANAGRTVNINQATTRVNGNLNINSGTLNINGSITAVVDGDISVASGATFGVSAGVSNLIVEGNFENAGTVKFTNKAAANYTADAGVYVALNFTNAANDQRFVCNGATTLEKLIVNKGTDDTYTLSVTASNTDNFNLWGRNNTVHQNEEDPGNVHNNKALNIEAGTLYLGSNIVIPSIITYQGSYNSFTIDQDATLILDGANVTCSGDQAAIAVYGKLKVIGNSVLTSTGARGNILRQYGVIEIGGNATFNASIIRPTKLNDGSAHRGTVIMTGGTLNISGNIAGNNSLTHASFSLPYPDNTFQMSGGTININSPSYYNTTSQNESWVIAANSDNISVTGGTVNISSQSRNAKINSTAPFYNLNITGGANTVSLDAIASHDGNVTMNNRPLVVLNNLSIANGTTFNPNNMDVTVGGNFTINGTYNPGTNTTTFNGFGLQQFTNSGTITNGLYNMVLLNKSVLGITNNLTIRSNLEINKGTTLRDVGRNIYVAGNITNSGVHEGSAAGSIQLNGTGDQIISGDGSGVFGTLALNKTAGSTSVECNIGINGNLRLGGTVAVLDIGANSLWLGSSSNIYSALTGTAVVFNTTRMVRTNGDASDLGIQKEWGTVGRFTYPLGVANKYTPATIEIFTPPTTWGNISVSPVNSRHPLATSTNCLNYYWNVNSQGIEGLSTGTSTLDFAYNDEDISGNEMNYRASCYYPPVWTIFASATSPVSTAINQIRFSEMANIRGHFTAGEVGAFGAVQTFYSKVNGGNWDTPSSWTNDPATNADATTKPSEYSPVIIRDGYNIVVSTNNQTVGSLTIQDNAVLDITTTTGHNFGMVTDSRGTLRISSAVATTTFPNGDFGEFLGNNGGTVEYYTTGAQNYTISSVASSNFGKQVPTLEETFEANNWNNWANHQNWNNVNTRAHGGNRSVTCNNRNAINYLTTQEFDLSDATSASLSFWRYHTIYGTPTLRVYISTTNATSREHRIDLQNGTNNTWQQVDVDLSAYCGNQRVWVAIAYQAARAGTTSSIYIDDIEITKTLSNSASKYHNLHINPSAGRTITFPDENVSVSGNMRVIGAGVAATSPTKETTVKVEGKTAVEAGTFQISNNKSFTLVQMDTLVVNSGATFEVANTGTVVENKVNIYGDVINNGSINFSNGNRYASLYFRGENNQVFSGTGNTANFYDVYVDKGLNQVPMVDIVADRFNMTQTPQSLFLYNGTIRFTGASLTPVITTTSSFTIPQSACLSVNGSNVTVCNANSGDYDLFLNGKLEVMAGTMNVGNTANNVNNDIEYPAAEFPQIVVSGGTLNVNGQVRRGETSANGSLNYSQSGGNVYIYGKNRMVKRSLLEVLNSGTFNMSDGNLYLVQGVASNATTNTFGELYLNPQSSEVTGGTIIIGTATTNAASNYFNLYLACPIFNLTIDGQTNDKYARLRTFEATFKGSLLINGPSTSRFLTNKINVNIAGDLISTSGNRYNSYDFADVNQRTTFNGVNQKVHHDNTFVTLGGLQFGEFYVDLQSNGTLTIEKGETNIKGHLHLVKGKLVQNVGRILATKNIYLKNGFQHISNGTSDLRMNNTTTTQYIYTDGSGSLGRLSLYHGLDVVVEGDLGINNVLQFSSVGNNAKLNIGQSKLTFAENATIGTGNYAPNSNRYIVTNGSLSDGGVAKQFKSTGDTFTYPVGVGNVGGKYTPAIINITNTGGATGTVTVKPVDAYHPATTNTTINDQLQYFWNVESEGFGENVTVTHTYTYVDSDVEGDENEYMAARYDTEQYTWTSGSTIGNVDVVQNKINFPNIHFIDGEYTAGQPADEHSDPNFGNVEFFYSKQSGFWEDLNTWLCQKAPSPDLYPATKSPNGNPVFIRNGHTITTSENNAYAASVDIESGSKLDIKQTIYHNLGHITGAGVLAIEAITGATDGLFKFPGGDAQKFLSTSGSRIEYSGTGTLPANITSYMNVNFLVNSSIKTIPAIDITVGGDLNIIEGQLINLNNGTITVEGNWNDQVNGGFDARLGTVIFGGESNSTLYASGGETFYNLSNKKAVGSSMTLNSPLVVKRIMTLNTGTIVTSATNILTVDYSSPLAVVGGSSVAYIDGPLKLKVNSNSSAYFPVGDDGRYGRISISQTQTSGEQYWIGEYVNSIPIDNTNFADPIRAISDNEYWKLTGVNGAKANITIRWDANSGSIIGADLDKLRIAQYLPPWTVVGDKVDVAAKNVSTTTALTFNGVAQQFTLSMEETASAKITSSDVEECNDGTNLPVSFVVTGDAPLSVDFYVNGVFNRRVENLSASTHTIEFSYEELYAINGAGDYTISIGQVRDANNREGIIQGSPVTLTAKATPNPIISGPNSVMTSSTTSYQVATVEGDIYFWSVSANGTIGTAYEVSNPTSISWGATAGNATITLYETNPTTTCYASAQFDVVIRDWPVIVGNGTPCANSTEVYSSKQIAGHTYNWTVEGGTIVSGAGTYQITVQWSTQIAGLITLSQGTVGNMQEITQNIQINPAPVASIIAINKAICHNDVATVTLGGSHIGTLCKFYVEQYNPTTTTWDELLTSNSTGNVDLGNFPWIGPYFSNSYLFRAKVYNLNTGCESGYTEEDILVYRIPETGPQYHISNDNVE